MMATRKNYVTLKQLQEQRLKEKGDEEQRLRNLRLDLNTKRGEAARSSKDRPPPVSLRRDVAKPASPSIPELEEAERTAGDSAPAPPIVKPAGGDRKPTWREKQEKRAKSESEKRPGPGSAAIESDTAEGEEKSIAVNMEGEGRNRRGVGRPKPVGVPGGRGSEWPGRIERQRFNGSYGAVAGAPRRSWMPPRGGDGRRLRNATEGGSVWVRKTTNS